MLRRLSPLDGTSPELREYRELTKEMGYLKSMYEVIPSHEEFLANLQQLVKPQNANEIDLIEGTGASVVFDDLLIFRSIAILLFRD
jgi:hypothetical protein